MENKYILAGIGILVIIALALVAFNTVLNAPSQQNNTQNSTIQGLNQFINAQQGSDYNLISNQTLISSP